MKKAEGIKHVTALNKVAQEHGFKDWQALLRSKDETR
jgi:hypothetical protein